MNFDKVKSWQNFSAQGIPSVVDIIALRLPGRGFFFLLKLVSPYLV